VQLAKLQRCGNRRHHKDRVTRTGGRNSAVFVNYNASGGSAVKGVDPAGASGALSFAAGSKKAQTFTVSIIDDTVVDGNEAIH
jgi:hypothetical protein